MAEYGATAYTKALNTANTKPRILHTLLLSAHFLTNMHDTICN